MKLHVITGVRMLLCASLIALIAAPLSAEDTLVSRGRGDLNLLPRAAYNTETGDVFIVWRGAVAGDFANFRIYSSLLRRQSSANFTVQKARLIAGGVHKAFNFDVAYDPLANRYLVVWNGADSGDRVGSLFGQFFKANGRPLGPRRLIVQGDDFEPLRPLVAPLIEFGGNPADTPRFMAVYSWTKNDDVAGSGLRSILIDEDGSAAGNAEEIAESIPDADGFASVFLNERLSQTGDGSYLVITRHQVGADPVVDIPTLIKLRANGTRLAKVELDTLNSGYTSVVELGPKRMLAFWRHGQDYFYRLVNPKTLVAKRKTVVSDEIGFAANSQLVKLDDDPGALHFIFRSTSIRVFYVNGRGTAFFPGLGDIELGRNLGSEVAAVPIGDNRVLLLYSLEIHSGASEVRAMIYEPNLP
jgi:hypothetical protein